MKQQKHATNKTELTLRIANMQLYIKMLLKRKQQLTGAEKQQPVRVGKPWLWCDDLFLMQGYCFFVLNFFEPR